MARNKPTETTTTTSGTLRVGRDVGIPMAQAGSDVRSLKGMDRGESKQIAKDFLTVNADGKTYRYSDVRYVPAGWADPAEIADRDGLHRAIDRVYNTLAAMESAESLELPDGTIVPIRIMSTNAQGVEVAQPVTAGLIACVKPSAHTRAGPTHRVLPLTTPVRCANWMKSLAHGVRQTSRWPSRRVALLNPFMCS